MDNRDEIIQAQLEALRVMTENNLPRGPRRCFRS